MPARWSVWAVLGAQGRRWRAILGLISVSDMQRPDDLGIPTAVSRLVDDLVLTQLPGM